MTDTSKVNSLRIEDVSDSGIAGRDEEIVRVIENEELSVFTFDGLRRITGAHPETLSRALDRLEEGGYVTKSPDGYSSTGKIKSTAGPRQTYEEWNRVPILHTFLPSGASLDEVVSSLKGRWFDRLRWVGIADSEEGVAMKWVTDDGSVMIDVKFSSGQMNIEARLKSETGLPDAVRAAHQLIGRLSKLYSRPRSRKSPLVRIGYFGPYAM